MDLFKERDTPCSAAQSSSSQKLKAEISSRRGVEGRETVLQQAVNAPDIIVIDIDDESGTSSEPQSRRRPHRPDPVSAHNGHVVERRYIASTVPQTIHAEGVAVHDGLQSKEQKFLSTESAQRHMYESSDASTTPKVHFDMPVLPSPPHSSETSPQSTAGVSCYVAPDESSWGFDKLESNLRNIEDADQMNEQQFLLQMSKLTNSKSRNESNQGQTPMRKPNRPRREAEEASLFRSEQLRASRVANAMSRGAGGTQNIAILERQRENARAEECRSPSTPCSTTRLDYEEDGDIEQQLDQVQILLKEDGRIKPTASSKHLPAPVAKQQGMLKSASRATAEKFRMQSFHLEPRRTTAKNKRVATAVRSHSPPILDVEDEEQRNQDRGERVQQKAMMNPFLQTKEIKRPPMTFHDGLNGDKRQKKKTKTSHDSKKTDLNIRKIMGINDQSPTGDATTAQSPNSSDESQSQAGQVRNTSVGSSIDILSKLDMRDVRVHRGIQQGSDVKNIFEELPSQGQIEHLTLPSNFDKLSEPHQKALVQRETLKERERDLFHIAEVYKAFAQRLSMCDPGEREEKELVELRKFCEAVLDRDCSGRPARARIAAIRGNLKRRMEGKALPDEGIVNKRLHDLMKPEYVEKLQERGPVHALYSKARAECGTFYHKKKDTSKVDWKEGRQGRPSGTYNEKAKSLGKYAHLSQSERGRQVWEDGITRQADEVKKALARFEQPDANTQVDLDQEINLDVDHDGTSSIVSEEDEGKETMHGAGFASALPPGIFEDRCRTKTQLKERQPSNTATLAASKPIQAADQSLFERMTNGEHTRAHLKAQETQKVDSQTMHNVQKKMPKKSSTQAPADHLAEEDTHMEDPLVDSLPEREFEDTDIDVEDEQSEEWDDEEGQPQCRRYIAKAFVNGVHLEYDGEHLLGNFLSRERAKREVVAAVQRIKDQYAKSHRGVGEEKCSTTICDTIKEFEHKMTFDENESVGCRAWVEEELYNPSEEAYQKAKVYRACQPVEAWFVDWQRIIRIEGQGIEANSEGTSEDGNVPDLQEEVVADEDRHYGKSQTHRQDDIINVIEGDNIGASPVDVVELSSNDQPERVSNTNAKVEALANVTASESIEDITTNTSLSSTTPSSTPLTSPGSTGGKDEDTTIDDITAVDDDLFDGTPSPRSSPQPQLASMSSSTLIAPVSPPTATANEDIVDNDLQAELLEVTNTYSTPSPAPQPSPPPPPPPPQITRLTGDQLRLFPSIAHANRHAKSLFMDWFWPHLPGSRNARYIQSVDDEIEEELKEIGDRVMWKREEEFAVEEGHEAFVDDKFERVEVMRVWVRRARGGALPR